MMMTNLRRIEILKKELREFLMNDKDTQDLYRKGNPYKGGEKIIEDKFFQSFIANICEVVVNSIGNFEWTYTIPWHYLDISYLDVYITPKKFIYFFRKETHKSSACGRNCELLNFY